MAKKYHTLLSRVDKATWQIEFGDYIRKVVIEERNDIKERADKGTKFLIITTDPTQSVIDAEVARLNFIINVANVCYDRKPETEFPNEYENVAKFLLDEEAFTIKRPIAKAAQDVFDWMS